MKEHTKKWGWGFLALLSCPCHLVLILPLLAGTTFGAYFAVIFVISLWMMFKRADKKEKANATHDCCAVPERK
jgi:mercuric ion transport protein